MKAFIEWLSNLLKQFFAHVETVESSAPKPITNPKPITPVPLENQILGVDISHHNKEVSFAEIRKGGYLFCFHKATEGQSFVDPKFKERRLEMKKAGMIYGFYHFFRANIDPKKQAEHFLRTVGDDMGDLPPVMDWETIDKTPRDVHLARASVFLDIVEKETGRTPIIYTGSGVSDFSAHVRIPAEFERYPLWVADYGKGRTTPRMPSAWKHYTFWQYSESGIVPGVGGRCDTNYFNGTLDQLTQVGIEVKLA